MRQGLQGGGASLLDRWRVKAAAGSPRVTADLVGLLAENPFWTLKGAAERLGVAFTTAQRAMGRLESLKIVRQFGTGQRDRVWCARSILDILEEPARLVPEPES